MSEVPKSHQSFSGNIKNIELINLAQLVCLAQTNHAIAVKSASGEGAIFARSGHLYHAQCGERRGEDAFYEILRWTKGRFAAVLHEALETPTSITRRWEYLLIKAAQDRMEARELSERSGRLDSEQTGFAGTIKDIKLVDLVQLVCQSGGSHTVKVVSEEGKGFLHAQSGQICHAEAEGVQGVDAFATILHWHGGRFDSLPFHEIANPTISSSWEALLVEATRHRDEAPGPPGSEAEDAKTEGEAEARESGDRETATDSDTDSSTTDSHDSGKTSDTARDSSVPTIGFSGSIDSIELTDLLQLFALGMTIHQIDIESPEGRGTVYVGAGSIRHAQSEEKEGEPAFYQVMRLSGARFESSPARSLRIKETIQKAWEFLLIEGSRLQSQATEEGSPSGMPSSPRSRFGGRIHEISLSDLIHLVCLSKYDHLVKLTSGEKNAAIYVRGKQVFHAEAGDLHGPEAFFESFRWINGSFEVALLTDDSSVPTTIELPWEFLLMEAVRLMDERSGTGDSDDADGGAGPKDEAEALEQRLQKIHTLQELETFSKKLSKMHIVEKIRLALTGDKEARSNLIRESNRMIQVAVIRNPRISEHEVLTIGNSKNVDEEVLRMIASNRHWVRSYALRLALVNNPKTPVPKALQFVTTLMMKDLSLVAKSKNIPEAVVQAARRRLAQQLSR